MSTLRELPPTVSEPGSDAAKEVDARARGPLHQPALHESGHRHTTGEALYVDDLPPPRGLLLGHVVCSPHARARIVRRSVGDARDVPGVVAVFFAEDIPGQNQIGAVFHDEPLLAENEVFAEGQPVALVLCESYEAGRRAARALDIVYEELPAILSVKQAIAASSFHCEPHIMRRGTVDDATFAASAIALAGEFDSGGQEHFYLESQCALAVPEENRTLRIYSSTQHPSEVQAKVAEVLGLGRHEISVEVPRLGGGFGGKETQAAPWAALAALAAHRTGRPVKIWLNRDQDMVQTGKRHPFHSRYEAACDGEGRVLALRVYIYADAGWSNDLSRAILDRALFHLDNCYYLPNLYLEGHVAKTNTCSHTAFRGFGGPQGMLVVEEILSRVAERLGLDPALVRQRNFYGEAPRNRTPYDQEVVDFRGGRIFDELIKSSRYFERRADVADFNARNPLVKRGIAFQPVKFGISFTTSFLNQAGALVVVYADGGVQLNHGGTEMGQGLHTKMIAVCAHELGVPVDKIRVMTTATDKVPNTSATAASSGSDLNGQAVKQACETLRERMRPIAARLIGLSNGREQEAQKLVFAEGKVFLPGGGEVPFAKVASEAYLAQTSLAATGYYRTPGIHYDRARGLGHPFFYYAYGGAVTEVEVSALTGEHRVLRVDILHDVGTSLVPTVDVGQIEGGFIQGQGWLTCEELVWDARGRLLTHSPSTYKIPAIGEAPVDFRVALLERAPQDGVIHGSKAVGEPPLMLAISVVSALRHAVSAFTAPNREVTLKVPCTPEAILRAIDDASRAIDD